MFLHNTQRGRKIKFNLGFRFNLPHRDLLLLFSNAIMAACFLMRCTILYFCDCLVYLITVCCVSQVLG